MSLSDLVDEKIKHGTSLLGLLKHNEHLEGVSKISRKIRQEIKFLEKTRSTGSLKKHHILCSNLTHFEALVNALNVCPNVVHIDFPVTLPDRDDPIRVDIVCNGGFTWAKVIARNPKSLSDAANGRNGYGSRSILDQASDLMEASSLHTFCFKYPEVVFVFTNTIDTELTMSLEEIGVKVYQSLDSLKEKIAVQQQCELQEKKTLNLDITTLIAYVSALANGSANWNFKEPILSEQAQLEREKPIKGFLDEVFGDNRLICCQTAVNSFNGIMEMLGGICEKKRADELLRRVEVLADIDEIPSEIQKLCATNGRIKERSLQIFAFGIYHKAFTVTSNKGFIRSASMQGINIPVILHDARALTEEKEKTAQKIHEHS